MKRKRIPSPGDFSDFYWRLFGFDKVDDKEPGLKFRIWIASRAAMVSWLSCWLMIAIIVVFPFITLYLWLERLFA